MRTVQCGIKAFDIHELVCHLLAKRHGYYSDEGLEVRVVDVTFTPDDKLPTSDYFQVACGAAYLSRREGYPFKVLLAATVRPMFWLHAQPGIERIEQLADKRLASYPPVAPPHHFNRVALRNHGVDPDRDLEFWPCRDDIIRLALLREHDVDAALLSSAVSPVSVQELGLETIAWMGDELPFVTTGVATLEPILREQPEVIGGVVRAFERALADVNHSPDRTIQVIADLLQLSDDRAEQTYRLFQPAFTPDGRVSEDTAERGLELVGAELTNGRQVAAGDLYDFSLLERAG